MKQSSNGNSLQVLKREILIQPPGEPRSRWRSTQKVRATQNFIKDKMTGRSIYYGAFLKQLQKKLKMKSQEQKNVVFG